MPRDLSILMLGATKTILRKKPSPKNYLWLPKCLKQVYQKCTVELTTKSARTPVICNILAPILRTSNNRCLNPTTPWLKFQVKTLNGLLYSPHPQKWKLTNLVISPSMMAISHVVVIALATKVVLTSTTPTILHRE
jgi:hypothetical protein